jgi:Tol biopolymer transport system component
MPYSKNSGKKSAVLEKMEMAWMKESTTALQRTTGNRLGLGSLIIGVLLLLATMVFVTGCGSNAGALPGPTPTPIPTPTPVPTPTPTPTPAPNPSPSITTTAPNAATATGLAFTLTVKGANFVQGSQVEWNGSSRTTTFVSSSELQAAIMSADLATPGSITITVANPAPGGTSSGITFTVSPNRIAFESTRATDGTNTTTTGSTQNIWVMDPDGSNQTAFSKLTFGRSFRPAWSHDGTKLIFSSTRPLDGTDAAGPAGNIWVMKSDQSGLTALTKLTSNITEDFPSWSPDDSKIMFTSNRALDGTDVRNPSFASNIWTMNPDGSGVTVITKLNNSSVFGPVFSPDGTKIAYLSARALDGTDTLNTNAVQNLWVMNADGTGSTPVTKLTGANAVTTSFTWSPDGTQFMTLANRALDGGPGPDGDNTENLWVLAADGSTATLVTPQGQTTALGAATIGAVAWSPDGSKIVFISAIPLNGEAAPNSAQNLWIMNPDGTGALHLTPFDGNGVQLQFPVWSPNGSKIFFSSDGATGGTNAPNLNNTANIWVVNADDSGLTSLTKLTAAGASSTFPNRP